VTNYCYAFTALSESATATWSPEFAITDVHADTDGNGHSFPNTHSYAYSNRNPGAFSHAISCC